MKIHQMFSIANIVTLSRVFLVPIVFLLCLYQFYVVAIWLSGFMLISDFFDGKIARGLNQTSDLGALLDPVADKIIVLIFFPLFYYFKLLPLWFVFLVMTRDIAQLLSIPILNWMLKISFKVKPSRIAKWATALNFIILWLLFVTLSGKSMIFLISPVLISISAFLEIYILVTYVLRFYQISTGKHDTFE